jgi:hypothetical protein
MMHPMRTQSARTSVAAIRPTNRSRITNRTRLLENVGGRSSAARRFPDICANYEAEAGGNVTELERDLIRQAAGLTLRAEQMQGAIVRGEPVNNDELVRISSTAKRGLAEPVPERADYARCPARISRRRSQRTFSQVTREKRLPGRVTAWHRGLVAGLQAKAARHR